jgi:hypothetical protein
VPLNLIIAAQFNLTKTRLLKSNLPIGEAVKTIHVNLSIHLLPGTAQLR